MTSNDVFQVTALIGFSMLAHEVHLGLGRHASYIPFGQQISIAKLQAILQVPVMVSQGCSRISIALFLMKLFVNGQRWKVKPAMYSFIGFLAVTNCVCVVLVLPQCSPQAKVWNPTVEGSCWTQRWVIPVTQGSKARNQLSPAARFPKPLILSHFKLSPSCLI